MQVPDEFLTITNPQIKISGNEVEVRNKPARIDIAILLLFYVGVIKFFFEIDFEENKEYFYEFIFGLLVLTYIIFSVEHVVINIKERKIYRRSINPFTNFVRKKILQIPLVIPFSDIEKIYLDESHSYKQTFKYRVIIQTVAPYNLEIARFAKETSTILMIDFLKEYIK